MTLLFFAKILVAVTGVLFGGTAIRGLLNYTGAVLIKEPEKVKKLFRVYFISHLSACLVYIIIFTINSKP